MAIPHADVIQRYFDALWNAGQLEAADDLCTADIRFHLTFREAPIEGPEGLKQLVQANRTAFPDIHWTVQDRVDDGAGRVAVRWTMRATQAGPWMGIPAAHRPVAIQGMTFFYLADGRIREVFVISDALSMVQQLGAAPPLPLTSAPT